MFENRKGFTLIELLIVVVIIGILAAIALPKFGSTREAAYWSTLKADLNNLRSAQEIYYTTGAYEYAPEGQDGLEFSSSSGSTVTFATAAGGQAYSATATHAALETTEGCALMYGNTDNVTHSTPGGTSVAEAGTIYCDEN